MTGLVLDTGALIALQRGDRSIARRLQRTRVHGTPVTIPAGCVAQAWRDGSRQVNLARTLKQPDTIVDALDHPRARQVGELLARTGTADVVDAHVAVAALETGATVITSDPDDIRALAPTVRVLKA